jgi:hypothetical protein
MIEKLDLPPKLPRRYGRKPDGKLLRPNRRKQLNNHRLNF